MFGWWELVGPMPLNKRNTKTSHRVLYGGTLEVVRLIKRNPNMQASVTRSVIMYQCWWSDLTKSGQQHDNETMSNHRRTLHIPRCELDRVGVAYINPLDVFVDIQGRYWQNEGDEPIDAQLWENFIDVHCRKTDPI